MRQPLYLRFLLLLALTGSLYALMRHAQGTADARAAAGEARFRARAAAFVQSLYERHGWQPACTGGHWLSTHGRRLVTDQGRRWHGIGADYEAGAPLPREASFVRLSAAPYLQSDAPATEPARLLALFALIERLSQQGQRYVLIGVPQSTPWLWRAQMATLVYALADRPEVLFDLSSDATGPAPLLQVDIDADDEAEGLLLSTKERIEWIRGLEQDAGAPKHVIAIDAAAIARPAQGHHAAELDYACAPGDRLPSENVVTLGRRPAYALRSANAWFVEPLRAREPSVRPASL